MIKAKLLFLLFLLLKIFYKIKQNILKNVKIITSLINILFPYIISFQHYLHNTFNIFIIFCYTNYVIHQK